MTDPIPNIVHFENPSSLGGADSDEGATGVGEGVVGGTEDGGDVGGDDASGGAEDGGGGDDASGGAEDGVGVAGSDGVGGGDDASEDGADGGGTAVPGFKAKDIVLVAIPFGV